MKRVIGLLMILALVLVAVPVAGAIPAGYTAITTQAELAAIADNLSGKYMLVKNITLTDDFTAIATDPDAPFTGVLDGDGYTIYGLNISYSSDGTAAGGLFGYNAGTVCNLMIADSAVSVTGTDPYSTAYTYAGAIAGINTGTIENCSVSAAVSGTSETLTAYVGGIVGENKGSVSKCAFYGSVSGKAISEAAVGGIAGWNKNTVVNSMNAAEVKGIAGAADALIRAGGIAGKNGFAGVGSISLCHNAGTVANEGGEADLGGIAGSNLKTVENTYYLATTADSAFGTAADTTGAIAGSAYRTEASFAGFDFTNTWTMGKYPILKDQPVMELLGDVDGNGAVNTADVTTLLRYINGHAGVTVTDGDLNLDGEVDIIDAIRLLKVIGA